MSRICVKNLPKHATEERLRDYFSQKGEVTDAKLMRTRDGKSRQFGFVGFRSEKEASEALKFFNGSFIDTYRISCEIARKVGDPEMSRPWSRHSLKKQEKSTVEKKESVKSMSSNHKVTPDVKIESENSDLQFQEFLQVMQPRAKSKLWSNDLLEANKGEDKDKKKLNSKSSKLNETSDNKPDEMESSMELDKAVSDTDYFKSRVKKDWSDTDTDTEDVNGDVEEDKNDEQTEAEEPTNTLENPNETDEVDEPSSSLEDEDDVLQTGRLFVRNLPYTATEDDLREHFSKFGSVSQAHLVVDKETKRSKGIAYILYALPESAARALEDLDNSIVFGMGTW